MLQDTCKSRYGVENKTYAKNRQFLLKGVQIKKNMCMLIDHGMF